MTKIASQALSTVFGVAMVMVIAVGADRTVLLAAAVAVFVVLIGVVSRPAATLAVLLVVLVIALGNTPPMLVAVSGFCAAGYLVLRYSATVTASTVVAAAGFTVVGLAAMAFPLRLPWLPVLAPLAAFGCYVLASYPFVRRVGRNGLR